MVDPKTTPLTTKEINEALPRAPVHLPPHLDPTKSELAFEERMLPKLNRECKSENKLDTQRALKSLTDIVHSPEKIAETIQTGLFDTVGDLLKSDDDMCRNLASEIFSVMSTHNIGRTAGIKFIPHLASLFKDSNSSTRVNVHKTLFCLADIFSGNSAIVQNQLTPTLISLLETEEDIVKIWIVRTLCKNMRIAAQEALDNRGLEVLANLIENHTDVKILEHTLRALAEITYPFPGKIAANNHATLSAKLVEIVNEKTNEEVLKAAAAGAIGAMAITTQGKQNFYNLGALKACAEMLNAELSEARLNAVTAITIIGEIPEGRSYILAHEIEALRELKVDFNQLVRNAAIECCDAIEWKP